jgi:glycerophosphoryl diester phosphodiesterase
MQRPITVGHRGASALAPENSSRSFELAIEYGLDMAELDVHLSRDHEVMVTHDADLSRLWGRSERVADLSAADLQRMGIPRLVDVFELARGRLGLYVELKGPGTGAAVGTLVADAATSDVELVVGSFAVGLVREFREVDSTTPCSVLFERTTLASMIEACRSVGALFAHPCFRPVTQELVDGFHRAGLRVMTPHTNDPSEARSFAALGVDVIASDDPRVLRQLDHAA